MRTEEEVKTEMKNVKETLYNVNEMGDKESLACYFLGWTDALAWVMGSEE